LLSAAFEQVHGHDLVFEAFQRERDADAVGAAAAPVAVELHAFTPSRGRAPSRGTTVWSIVPKRFCPAASRISIRTRSPTFRNGVRASPLAMISRIRRSARQETPRASSSFEIVPLPRIVPAVNARVLEM